MDAAADDSPALAQCGERGRDKFARGSEQDGGVEGLGRRVVRAAGPVDADRARERLTGMVARPGEGEYAPPLPATDLGDDVPCGAEAIDADRLPVSGELERAPADQAGAEQRRRRDWVEIVGKRKDEIGLRDRMGRVAAVAGVAGEQRGVAQVFASAPAIGAGPVGVAEPSDADAGAGLRPTPSPTASTRPTISCPGTMGSFGLGSSPSTTWRSVRQIPQASTRKRTWPGPGDGSGRSSITSRSCARCRTMARIGARPVQGRREPATDRRSSA